MFWSCVGVGLLSAQVAAFYGVVFVMLRFCCRCLFFIIVDYVFLFIMIKILEKRVFVLQF